MLIGALSWQKQLERLTDVYGCGRRKEKARWGSGEGGHALKGQEIKNGMRTATNGGIAKGRSL